MGSVIPVKKDVSAAEAIKLPTHFLFSGFANLYMAKAAAGRPNIITGNSPAMKCPAVKFAPSCNWAKKIFMSPRTIFPAAVVYWPNSNQNGACQMW